MGLFGGGSKLDNADIDCSPQNDYVSEKTVAKIDDIVDPGEKIHYLAKEAGGGIDVEGSSAGSSLFGNDRSRKTGTTGYVRTAATDKRVLVKIPQALGNDERTVPYRNITSVDLDLGMLYKRLSLQTPGQTYHIDIGGLGKTECRKMARFVRDQISEAQETGSSGDETDPVDQLERLRDLKEDGVLTKEEFEQKKSDLLDKI